MRLTLTIVLLFCTYFSFGQTYVVNRDIQVEKLSDHAYLYTAWADIGSWGRVGSNGLILVKQGKAFLVDTPMHEKQTIELNLWIESDLKARIVGFVPGHWHSDCVGGMAYLNGLGVESYAGIQTNDILRSKDRPEAKHSFKDSITLSINDIDIKCYYLGGGHSTDNIVVWVPSEAILFGGCLLKDCTTTTMGNIVDAAPIDQWLRTVCAVDKEFQQVKTVIPGHGPVGGREIIEHTKKVLIDNIK